MPSDLNSNLSNFKGSGENLYLIISHLMTIYKEIETKEFRHQCKSIWANCLESCLSDIEIAHRLYNLQMNEQAFGLIFKKDLKLEYMIEALLKKIFFSQKVLSWSYLFKIAKILYLFEERFEKICRYLRDFDSIDQNLYISLYSSSQIRRQNIKDLLSIYQNETNQYRNISIELFEIDKLNSYMLPEIKAYKISYSDQLDLKIINSSKICKMLEAHLNKPSIEWNSSQINLKNPTIHIYHLTEQKDIIDMCAYFFCDLELMDIRIIYIEEENFNIKENNFLFKDYLIADVVRDEISLQKVINKHLNNFELIGSTTSYGLEIKNLLIKKNLAQAQILIDKLSEFTSDQAKLLIMQYFYKQTKKRFLEKKILKNLLSLDPNFIWAAHRLALLCLETGQTSYGLEILITLNRLNPLNYHRLVLLRKFYEITNQRSQVTAYQNVINKLFVCANQQAVSK